MRDLASDKSKKPGRPREAHACTGPKVDGGAESSVCLSRASRRVNTVERIYRWLVRCSVSSLGWAPIRRGWRRAIRRCCSRHCLGRRYVVGALRACDSHGRDCGDTVVLLVHRRYRLLGSVRRIIVGDMGSVGGRGVQGRRKVLLLRRFRSRSHGCRARRG